MATLSGKKIKEKFGNLLHVEGGITSATKDVEDGTGDASALKLSDTTVEIDGTLNFTAAPTTDSSTEQALFINGSDNVVKRELGTAAFKDEFPRIIARHGADETLTAGTNADLAFAAIDNSSATGSFIQDDSGNYAIADDSSGVVVGTAGIYRLDVSVYLTEIGSSAVATITLKKNGSALAIAIRSKSSNTKSVVSFYWAEKLAAEDEIAVNVSMATAGATITAGSALEVRKIA